MGRGQRYDRTHRNKPRHYDIYLHSLRSCHKGGGIVDVDMNGTDILPQNIVEDIAGQDIDLILEMGGGITWTINGLDVTTRNSISESVSVFGKDTQKRY